jgi:RNA polymerase sigma-70 factor, ECF subfamily
MSKRDAPRSKTRTRSQPASRGAAGLLERVYGELKALARAALRGERADHTLQPTALVHEAYLRLREQRDVEFQGRSHFLALSAQAMRRVLVDHARRKRRIKRGGVAARAAIDPNELALTASQPDDVLAVDEMVARLEKEDPRQARILEMRFFAGLSVVEVAEVLGLSKRTIEAEWTMLRAWLRRELDRAGHESGGAK